VANPSLAMQQILPTLKAQRSLPVAIVIRLIMLVRVVGLVMAVAASAQALHIMDLLAVNLIIIPQVNQSAQRPQVDDINMS